jgi:hypothetical protein
MWPRPARRLICQARGRSPLPSSGEPGVVGAHRPTIRRESRSAAGRGPQGGDPARRFGPARRAVDCLEVAVGGGERLNGRRTDGRNRGRGDRRGVAAGRGRGGAARRGTSRPAAPPRSATAPRRQDGRGQGQSHRKVADRHGTLSSLRGRAAPRERPAGARKHTPTIDHRRAPQGAGVDLGPPGLLGLFVTGSSAARTAARSLFRWPAVGRMRPLTRVIAAAVGHQRIFDFPGPFVRFGR